MHVLIARLLFAAAVLTAALTAAPRRVLYVTHSAGYRHDSIPTSRQVLEEMAGRSEGALEVVSTEDVSLINAETLRGFDILFFFTSGELALSDTRRPTCWTSCAQARGSAASTARRTRSTDGRNTRS
ncbi:MAG: hypothetical protein EXQ52_09125 [Bryobacterales bacterium]|nr:hypothetical protein [Bryobacterales bacterium]